MGKDEGVVSYVFALALASFVALLAATPFYDLYNSSHYIVWVGVFILLLVFSIGSLSLRSNVVGGMLMDDHIFAFRQASELGLILIASGLIAGI